MVVTQSLKRCWPIVVAVWLTGCATSSVFQSYPSQAAKMQQGLVTGQSDKILEDLADERDSADRLLYLQERGRLAQLEGKYADSEADFRDVGQMYDEQDLAAAVQVTEVGAQASSLLTNDNAIPYKGAGYERILVHHFQAFNYLGMQDVEGAGVEFRKAALEQQVLMQQHEAELQKAHEEASGQNVPVEELAQNFTGLDTIAGPVKVSFQNPYTFYTAAAFWEATGELNDALVDYKKVLEIYPDNTLVLQDVRRLSRRIGLEAGEGDDNAAQPGEGTVVILYEQDFIPPRSELKLPIPTFDGGLIAIAFPFYSEQTRVPLRPLAVSVDDQSAQTVMVADLGAQAAKHLQEQVYAMLVRQVLRGWAKYELQKQAGDHGGALAQLAATLYNIVSENADLRSWLTLPAWAQAQRLNLPAGSHTLALGGAVTALPQAVEIREGRTTLVRVVDVGGRRIVQVFPL